MQGWERISLAVLIVFWILFLQRVLSKFKSLRISLNTAHPACQSSVFISSSTHSFIMLHMSKPSQSATPHHIRHTLYTQKTELYKSTLRFLSFSDTPHIHLTIISSVLYRLQICFLHSQGFSPIYDVNTLWIQALYIFLFMWFNAPRAFRIELSG